MPHKHRSRVKDASQFDLPPSAPARPLPAGKPSVTSAAPKKLRTASQRRARRRGEDDTPKAFVRLMAFANGKRFSGLDNGDAPTSAKSKKRKRGQEIPPTASEAEPAGKEIPKIQPGERLADFAARVNQALPISGLARKGKNIAGTKERRTRIEKKITRMQDEWRKDELRLQEKEEEEREQVEEQEEDRAAEYGEEYRQVMLQTGKKSNVTRKVGELDGDEDPWAVLKASREEPKGLHDVAQAPPQFKAIPKEKFKVRNGAKVQVADVPNAAGSLRRREELGEERRNIIERYRQMMSKK